MSSQCYNICSQIDEANNNIDRILALNHSRNNRKTKEADVRNFLPRDYSSSYDIIKSRCTTCEFSYYNYSGVVCPCCGLKVRISAKNKKKYNLIRDYKPTLIIRSHVTGKGHYLT